MIGLLLVWCLGAGGGGHAKKGVFAKKGAINKIFFFHSKTVLLLYSLCLLLLNCLINLMINAAYKALDWMYIDFSLQDKYTPRNLVRIQYTLYIHIDKT